MYTEYVCDGGSLIIFENLVGTTQEVMMIHEYLISI